MLDTALNDDLLLLFRQFRAEKSNLLASACHIDTLLITLSFYLHHLTRTLKLHVLDRRRHPNDCNIIINDGNTTK